MQQPSAHSPNEHRLFVKLKHDETKRLMSSVLLWLFPTQYSHAGVTYQLCKTTQPNKEQKGKQSNALL